MTDQTYILSAGGTGGHLFPAQALASELRARGATVHLITDHRAEQFVDQFPADHIHVVKSATFQSKNPISIIQTLWALFQGVMQSGRILSRTQPDAVIGFGGYPTLPPVIAATQKAIPTLIHEQNAVMGRANKLLAGRVSAIAGGFLSDRKGNHLDKIIVTGNPVRPQVIEAAAQEYDAPSDKTMFHLLVFGGSQGAQFFGQTVPEALALVSDNLRKRIKLVLQARPEDVEHATARCKEIGVEAEISPFFDNMPQHIANAHLVVSRSGASTISELAAIGRPAILVPYPYALDHDQAENAKTMVQNGGADIIVQADLTKERLADILRSRIENPDDLSIMAQKAKDAGKPGATGLLADLLEAIGARQSLSAFKDKIYENA